MRQNYLTDAFSLNMLKSFPSMLVAVELDVRYFCAQIDLLTKENDLISALRYSNSAKIINTLCGVPIQKNKIEIKVDKGDTLYVVLPRFKIDDGMEMDEKTIKRIYGEGRIKFYKVVL